MAAPTPTDLLIAALGYANSDEYKTAMADFSRAQTEAADAAQKGDWDTLANLNSGEATNAYSAARINATNLFDSAYDALRNDPAAVQALPPQQQLQFNYLAKNAGDITQGELESANKSIFADSGVSEHTGEGAGRMQLNLLGNAPSNLGPSDVYSQLSSLGTYAIPDDPAASRSLLERLANNPIANLVATLVPGGTAILAGIRIGEQGDVGLADVLGIINGGMQVYSGQGLGDFVLGKGQDMFASAFPGATEAAGDLATSIKSAGSAAVRAVPEGVGDIVTTIGSRAAPNLASTLTTLASGAPAAISASTPLNAPPSEEIVIKGVRPGNQSLPDLASGIPYTGTGLDEFGYPIEEQTITAKRPNNAELEDLVIGGITPTLDTSGQPIEEITVTGKRPPATTIDWGSILSTLPIDYVGGEIAVDGEVDTTKEKTKTDTETQADLLSALPPQYTTVTTSPGELADIQYLYDIGGESIFAPQIEKPDLRSPYNSYASGGRVGEFDIVAEALRLLRGN